MLEDNELLENFNNLLKSIEFRVISIFIFNGLSTFAMILKGLLLVFLGIPFAIVNIFGILVSLVSMIPFLGIVFMPLSIICDLLGGVLFFIIMSPHLLNN